MQTDEVEGKLIGRHSFVAYKGELEFDEDGNVLNEVEYESPVWENIVVNNGKNLALDRLFGLSGAVAITSVGVGINSAAATVADTRLDAGVTGSVLVKTADAGTARAAQVVTIKATFSTSEANFNWNEAGLFNGNTNGTSVMFNRVVIGPFNKTSAVSIIYTTTVTQS